MSSLLPYACFGLSLFPLLTIASEYLPPERPRLDTYLAKAGRNPFGPASEKAVETKQPDFAKHLYINGIMNYGGEVTVYIADKNDKSVFSVTPNRSYEDIQLIDHEISPTVGASTITISNGSQTAKLTFDQAQMFTASPKTNSGGNKPAANKTSQQNAQDTKGANAIAQDNQGRAQQQRQKQRRPTRVVRGPSKK